jgi:hypothetical protein
MGANSRDRQLCTLVSGCSTDGLEVIYDEILVRAVPRSAVVSPTTTACLSETTGPNEPGGRQSLLRNLADDGMLWLYDGSSVPAYAPELYLVDGNNLF